MVHIYICFQKQKKKKKKKKRKFNITPDGEIFYQLTY